MLRRSVSVGVAVAVGVVVLVAFALLRFDRHSVTVHLPSRLISLPTSLLPPHSRSIYRHRTTPSSLAAPSGPAAPFSPAVPSSIDDPSSVATPCYPTSDGVAPAATDEEELLHVPLAALREPALPSGSWFSDTACEHYRTHFGRTGSLPDARLASFLRSGNTWTRYLLEAATGLATCGGTWHQPNEDPREEELPSVVDVQETLDEHRRRGERELLKMGFIGEDMLPTLRNCLVTKTHARPPPWRRTGRSSDGYPVPAILLVRDPFATLVSLRHYHTSDSVLLNRSRAEAKQFGGADWTAFVANHSLEWQQLATAWATGPMDTLLVPYELLVRQPQLHLQAMLTFLGVQPARGRLVCTLRHLEGRFHNTHHPVALDRTVFDADVRALVWGRIHELDELLRLRGYSGLPMAHYSFADEFHETDPGS